MIFKNLRITIKASRIELEASGLKLKWVEFLFPSLMCPDNAKEYRLDQRF